jgi:riboflavin kinase / FMN adenylyltransferase
MRTEIGFEHIWRDDSSVVTVGTFDGVHLGHQAILRYLRSRAEAVGGVATVVSFDPHPREVVLGEHVPLLTPLEERGALLASHAVERFVVLPFTRDLSMLEAEDYVRDILIGTVGLREIVIGYDHAFGRDRGGNRETLERMGSQHGFTVDVIPEQMVAEAAVSSTRIRNLLLQEGNVREAAGLMGRHYSLWGTVVRGDQRGRTIGYPTANLQLPATRKLVPRDGVYAVRVTFEMAEAAAFNAMMNIGRRPTFEAETEATLEVHLLDFDGDLYGRTLTVELVERIRAEQRFDGPDHLADQLRKDEAATRRLLGSVG